VPVASRATAGAVAPLDSLDGRAHAEDDPLVLEYLGQNGARVLVGRRQEAAVTPDQRHPGAETAEGLRQLDADRAAAEHDQVVRQLGQLEDVVVGQVRPLGQAGDRRHRRRGAGADEEPFRRDGAVADLERARVPERGRPEQDVDALASKLLGRFKCVDPLACRVHRRHDIEQLDGHLTARHAGAAAGARGVRGLGGVQERLGGHAASPGAVATDPGGLRQGDPEAEPSRETGASQAGRAGADDDQIVRWAQACTPSAEPAGAPAPGDRPPNHAGAGQRGR
jgi:hypothetical protein